MITLPRPVAAKDAPRGRVEDALLDRVDAALDAEREALMLGDEDRLARAEREKSSLMDALVARQEDKKGPGSINTGLGNASNLATSSPAPVANARLRELADKNRLNGLLIAERLGEVQRRRQFFERVAGRGSVYGPDGITRPACASQSTSRI